jgi:hypothetical protein
VNTDTGVLKFLKVPTCSNIKLPIKTLKYTNKLSLKKLFNGLFCFNINLISKNLNKKKDIDTHKAKTNI